MSKRFQNGAGIIIILALFIAILLLGVAVALQISKTKEIERSMSMEYNLKTYYVALAGLNECIATRMAPRSNVLLKRKDLSAALLNRFDRLENSGFVNLKADSQDLIGTYTYIALVVHPDSKGNYVIDDFNTDEEADKYLIYSKGTTTLPDGCEDSVIIKALFDLNRFDDDIFQADEIEEMSVIPVSNPESSYVDGLIAKIASDKLPPMVREISFKTYNGDDVVVGVHSKDDKIEVSDISARSKINIQFTEPIDGRFLDGIKLTNVYVDKPVEKLKKVVLSPKNIEVLILPPEKSDGRVLDFGSKYRLQISGVADYNGNILPEGPEIVFSTQMPTFADVSSVESTSDSSSDASNSQNSSLSKEQELTSEKNPFDGKTNQQNQSAIPQKNSALQSDRSGVGHSSVQVVDYTGF